MLKIFIGFTLAILLLNIVICIYNENIQAVFGWGLATYFYILYNVEVEEED